MYIEKTTAAERLIVQQVMESTFVYVMRARRLLMMVLGKFFEDAEQKPIDRLDAEGIADILQTVNDALWWAETEYGLTVGDEAVPGCESSYKGAESALLVRNVERLRSKLPNEDTTPYLDMSDEELLPILQEIAKRKGVTVCG